MPTSVFGHIKSSGKVNRYFGIAILGVLLAVYVAVAAFPLFGGIGPTPSELRTMHAAGSKTDSLIVFVITVDREIGSLVVW